MAVRTGQFSSRRRFLGGTLAAVAASPIRTWKTIEMKCGHGVMIDQSTKLAAILESLG